MALLRNLCGLSRAFLDAGMIGCFGCYVPQLQRSVVFVAHMFDVVGKPCRGGTVIPIGVDFYRLFCVAPTGLG